MSNDPKSKSLKDLAADYAKSINAGKEADRHAKEAADAAELERKAAAAAVLEREAAIISEFVDLVLPPLTVIHETLNAGGVDATLFNWWAKKSQSERQFSAHDARKSEKLVEFTFANHPKDPHRRSRMMFCVSASHNGPEGSKTTSTARDAYVLYTDGLARGVDPAHPILIRRAEHPLTKRDGTRHTAREIEEIVGLIFAELKQSSEKRCKDR